MALSASLAALSVFMTDAGRQQHHTGKLSELKSHPRFHGSNLPYALAWRALARA
jgi:hypothetical protein